MGREILQFLRNLDIISYMQHRNKAVKYLQVLEDGFLEGLWNITLGYNDQFEELSRLFSETNWRRYLNATIDTDKRIDIICAICQIPQEVEDVGMFNYRSQY